MSASLTWNPTYGIEHADKLPAMSHGPTFTPAAATGDSEEADVRLYTHLEAIKAGDQQALGKLYDLTVARVYGLALRITGKPEAAEEVTEDVYLQVWRTARDYHRERGKVIAWLLTISRSRAIDSLRRRDQAQVSENPEDLAPHAQDEDPQDLLQATQRHDLLHAAIARLSAVERQMLSLAFFRGLTHEEIAEHSKLPLGTVKTHLRRALTHLRAELGNAI